MYKLTINTFGGEPQSVIKIDSNGIHYGIPFDPSNTDYKEYLTWLAEGNIPEPADNLPE